MDPGPLTEPKHSSGNEEEKKTGAGRKMTQDELRELSRKGLCFKCGEKWGPEHVCKFRKFQLILMEGKEEETEEEVMPRQEEELELEAKILQLSLRSKEGLTSNQSFKVWGAIDQWLVLILVDSGATSNFIPKGLVHELNLAVEETSAYMVEVGTGERVHNSGVCRGIILTVQGVCFEQNFFMMELEGTEVILGMDWLAS